MRERKKKVREKEEGEGRRDRKQKVREKENGVRKRRGEVEWEC